jgi:hypothetical protein
MTKHPNPQSPALTPRLLTTIKDFLSVGITLLYTPGADNRLVFLKISSTFGEFLEIVVLLQTRKLVKPTLILLLIKLLERNRSIHATVSHGIGLLLKNTNYKWV